MVLGTRIVIEEVDASLATKLEDEEVTELEIAKAGMVPINRRTENRIPKKIFWRIQHHKNIVNLDIDEHNS